MAILTLARDEYERASYFMRVIGEVWASQGVGVRVQRGPGEVRDADLVVNHVDITVTPPAYAECLAHARRTINGRVLDISKRVVSQSLVKPGDGYAGPVMVKTDRNFGGVREARQPGLWRRCRRWWQSCAPWTQRDHLRVDDYRVFDTAAQVPEEVWRNPHLVVERFLPERRDGCFCLRTWTFLGDRETNSLSYAREPVVKSAGVVRREVIDDVPDELRAHRRRLGFDFGKFDYVLHDGRVVLFDANRTPALGHFAPEQYLPRMRLLAEGLPSLMDVGVAA